MEIFLFKALQLILAFAILVIIHEFGHFFFARLFGVRVEKFYIFFDPWTELFKWRPRKYIGGLGRQRNLKGGTSAPVPEVKDAEGRVVSAEAEESEEEIRKRGFWGDTEYGIGWLPFGGYCKISGMIDESMDREQMAKPAKSWEFRSKPAWQRLLIMVAGVLFNFLLAIVIYAGIVYSTGERYVELKDAELGMQFSPVAQKAGFRNGDIPLTVDGRDIDTSNPVMQIAQGKEVKVLRGSDTVRVAIPSTMLLDLNKELEEGDTKIAMMAYRVPVQVQQTMTGDGADKAGIVKGDRIIAIDTVATPSIFEFMPALESRGGRKVKATVVRNATTQHPDTLITEVQLSEGGKMGIGMETDPGVFFKVHTKQYNLLQSVPRGVEMGVTNLTNYAKSMKQVFTKEGAKSVGGFGSIGSIFPETWNWIAFWNIAAFLSVALAFMNILPIPALDGGHVLFLLYEVIFRRKPSEKFMEYAQMTGMAILLLLLVYANGMDIIRLFK